MFICRDCHHTECQVAPAYCASHDYKDSYGRCEVCGETKGCADCQCHHFTKP